MTDQTEQDPLEVLLQASAMLLALPDHEAVLSGILDLASKIVAADAYAVWLDLEGDGTWRATATRGLSAGYRRVIHLEPGESPGPIEAVEDVFAHPFLRRHAEAYAAEGIRSLFAVPLNLGSPKVGTITFYWRTLHTISPQDRSYAEALANLVAAALTTSELYEQKELEKRRLSFLAEASTILSSSLDYETTLKQVGRLAVPHIADWCTMHLVEDGAIHRIVVAHADPAMLAKAEEYSRKYPEVVVPTRGIGAVLRTGQSEFYPRISAESLAAAAIDEEHLEYLRTFQLTSSILVPLAASGKVLGTLRLLAAGSGRYFTQSDVHLAEDLARRAASAIENAKLHRAVLKQQNELRLSHAAARMGSWSMDLVKGEVHWSDEFKALHRMPLDTRPSFEGGRKLVHPDDAARVLHELEEVLASDADQILAEHRAVTSDGRTLWLQSRGSISRDSSGKATAVLGITMDVTEAHHAHEALRRTEKLAAAGRLAATVAHEVNNPLEALTNLVYLALHADNLPGDARTYLETASIELGRMAHVVRQTLGFYCEPAAPQPTDLNSIVAETVGLYRSRAITRSVALSCSSERDMMALANPGEIRQVLANLVANSLDACAPGDTVHVSVLRVGQCVRIDVIDSGSGIEEVHLERIFEPFFTTKSEVGTGLGLWVSKGIVEKHGGTIEVSSRTLPESSGTTFSILLPALAPVPEPAFAPVAVQ